MSSRSGDRQGLYQCPVRHGEKPKVPKEAVNICHLHHQGGKASASNHLPPVLVWLPLGEGGSKRCRRKRQQPRVLLRALKDRGDSLGSAKLTGKHEDLSSIPESMLK